MFYTLTIEIDRPRKEVVQLFDNPENLKEWQPGFQGLEHLSGEPGTEGAKSKILYKMGKRNIEMIETIVKHNLPDEFHGTFEAQGTLNIQKNYFTELDNNRTLWTSECEFQFSSFGLKLMAVLMPRAFKKQSYQFMLLFKQFAERTLPAPNDGNTSDQ
ncbi:MAG: SRPBCC family protein [Owenweeksia sp.]